MGAMAEIPPEGVVFVSGREEMSGRGYDIRLRSGYEDSFVPVTRHPSSARFHELLKEAGDLHDRKQTDYGRGDDPFANVRASDEWGIPGWVGAMVRLSDKVRRLQALATKGALANEAAVDSFMDIAVYALIARVLYEQENSGETHEDPKVSGSNDLPGGCCCDSRCDRC